MHELAIKITPFEIIDLLQLEIEQTINQHGHATVVGHIPSEKEDQYAEMAQKNQWLSITATAWGEEDQIIFKGIIESITIQVENSLRKITIKSVTSSYLADLKTHSQTFQDQDMTYQEALGTLNSHYEDFGVYMSVGRLDPLQEFIVQYQETDWAFAKRLASHFQSFLVAEAKIGGGIKFYFGLPNRTSEVIDTTSYGMRKEVGEYYSKTENDVQLRERDAIYYTLESRHFYGLGTLITLNGRELVVAEVQTNYQGGQCTHHYQLKTREGLSTLRQANPAITGASLDAKVLSVEKDQVKVHVLIDQVQDSQKAKWFPYATVYSSTSGAGWYCMPEIGDSVRLYFPHTQESQAFVNSAIHLAGADNRNDPEIKLWKTKYGKEIRLTPDAMILTNNAGLRIELSDQKGILIQSNKDITIAAEGDITIDSAQSSIAISGQNQVTLEQNTAMLTLKKDITFQGAKVKME